ncbi:MAG TPA: type II secretion system protein GspJ [Phycisphaerae bacterium]|nr:type II secretion system protein GspJ [Phycisphaerae bacterium]HUT59800.1 type II secretion system protein GspJ [Phycisphaerae bacterium]
MNNRRRQARAFTLLELLAATAMTAVLAGSLYATLHTAFKARRNATSAVEQVRKAELAVELVRADIESAVVPKGILAGAFVGETGVNEAGQPSDTLVLHCTADGAARTEGAGDIRMVEFAFESDQDGKGMILLRRVTLNLLATRVEEPTAEVLCRGVRSFDLMYYDGTSWQEDWDSGAHDNTLPLAVQATLELVAEDGTNAEEGGYWVSRVFRLACGSTAASGEAGAGP